MGAFGVCLGLSYLINEPWNLDPYVYSSRLVGRAICIALLGILSVTAAWLYLAIRWIDAKKGWAEQQTA